jgi:[protein-PII] uridylyltransferase
MLNPVAMPKAPEAAAAQLSDALAVLAAEHSPIPRDAAIGAFRRHLARIQTYVRQAFEQEQLTGLQAARLLGALVDGVVAGLFEYVTEHAGLVHPDRLSVAATGGYGRGVLAPFSDIDLLFLTSEHPDVATLTAVEFMLYFLWDLGLKVGHATRSIED